MPLIYLNLEPYVQANSWKCSSQFSLFPEEETLEGTGGGTQGKRSSTYTMVLLLQQLFLLLWVSQSHISAYIFWKAILSRMFTWITNIIILLKIWNLNLKERRMARREVGRMEKREERTEEERGVSVYWTSWIYKLLTFIKCGKLLAIISSHIFPLSLPLLLVGLQYSYVCLIVSHRSQRLCTLFHWPIFKFSDSFFPMYLHLLFRLSNDFLF